MIYLIILGLLFPLAFVFGQISLKRDFLFLFCLFIYFIYWFLGPLNTYLINDYERLGGSFYEVFEDGLVVYCLGLFMFIIAYKLHRKKNTRYISEKQRYRLSRYSFTILFCLFLISVGVNFGGNIAEGGIYNYLLFFSDTLIVGFAILFYERKFDLKTTVLFLATVLYFLLLGFRYRIILLLVAYIFNLIILNNISLKGLLKWGLTTVGFIFILNFISLNRNSFRDGELDKVVLSADSPYELTPYQFLLHQTDNYKTDFIVYKHLQDRPEEVDYGESMFLHIFIRILPSSLFPNNVKPVIPQQRIIKQSFGTTAGFYSGAAVTNVFSYYIAFTYYGVILFMYFLGWFLAYISTNFNFEAPRERVIIVMIAMLLFQELTRGYFPQTITLLAYLFLGLKLLYKKTK
jgi:oligosaccharide repeat unit polymerase